MIQRNMCWWNSCWRTLRCLRYMVWHDIFRKKTRLDELFFRRHMRWRCLKCNGSETQPTCFACFVRKYWHRHLQSCPSIEGRFKESENSILADWHAWISAAGRFPRPHRDARITPALIRVGRTVPCAVAQFKTRCVNWTNGTPRSGVWEPAD